MDVAIFLPVYAVTDLNPGWIYMESPAIKVSVIMPAYNAAGSIRCAVSSALRQTERSLQLIVIDDASTDATVAMAREAAAQDGRLLVLHQSHNRGAAAARNLGLAHACGEWVALLDADDEMIPDRLQCLLAAAEERGADIVSDNVLLCPLTAHEPNVPMLSRRVLPAARWMTAAEFVAGNVGSRFAPRVSYGFLKPVIRRSFLQRNGIRYEEQNRFGEDYLLSLSCLAHGARWWLMPEAMYRYTVRDGSATDIQSAGDLLRIKGVEEAMLRHHPLPRSDPRLAIALRRHKAVIEHFYFYRAFTDAVKAGSMAKAFRFLLQHPSSFRHIMMEGALQAPRVALKAIRGGYRSGGTVRPKQTAAHTASQPGNQG